MNINIKAHFDEEKKQHRAKAMTEKEKLRSAISLKSAAQENLARELQKKKNLLRDNEAEGLDTTTLKDKIQELEPQIAKATEEMGVLRKAEQESEDLLQRSFEREDLMVSVLREFYHCEEAVVVDDYDAVFDLLPVTVTEFDKVGRPTKCRVWLTSDSAEVLTIKSSERHYFAAFRPERLKWLPIKQESPSAVKPQPSNAPHFLACYDKRAGKLILSTTSASWRETRKTGRQEYRPGVGHVDQTETIQLKDDFSDIAISLGTRLKNLVEAENGQLDLEKSYHDNPLLAHARSEVASLTNSEQLFKETCEVLTSVEIYNTIKADWDAFVNCPWSEQISGTLALLKYHVENGEKARFWSGDFENQFGFRLRTRDHDWIAGELFIDKSQNATAPKPTMEVHATGYNQSVIASLGGLFLNVRRDRSEREQR